MDWYLCKWNAQVACIVYTILRLILFFTCNVIPYPLCSSSGYQFCHWNSNSNGPFQWAFDATSYMFLYSSSCSLFIIEEAWAEGGRTDQDPAATFWYGRHGEALARHRTSRCSEQVSKNKLFLIANKNISKNILSSVILQADCTYEP